MAVNCDRITNVTAPALWGQDCYRNTSPRTWYWVCSLLWVLSSWWGIVGLGMWDGGTISVVGDDCGWQGIQ